MIKKEILYDEDDCPPLTEADFKVMRPYRLSLLKSKVLPEQKLKHETKKSLLKVKTA